MAGNTKHITQAIKYCKAAQRELDAQRPEEFDLANYEAARYLDVAESWLIEVRDNTKEDKKRNEQPNNINDDVMQRCVPDGRA